MNFYIFSAQYLPTVGGVERYTNSLALQLVKKGHNVTVVTSAVEGLPADEDENGINIIRLPVISLMNGRFPVLKSSSELRKFKKKFAENKPDFCVIQTRFYTNSIMAARLCAKNKVPAIVIEHGTAHLMNGGLFGAAGNIYEHLVCRYIYHLCPEFYGVSQSSCRWLKHFGITTNKILYNSVDPQKLLNLAEAGKETLLKKIPICYVDSVKIVFSGRFIPEKGVIQLIEAFKKLKEKYDNIVLLMGGDGPLFKTIDYQKCSDVVLLSRLPYEESLALIQLGNVFCLPTFSEGFATTVLEAAALKTYIVTTPTGGTPQLVIDDKYGTLIPNMSCDSIYSALDAILPNISKIDSAVEKTHINLINNFTWEKTCNKLIFIAENAVGRNI